MTSANNTQFPRLARLLGIWMVSLLVGKVALAGDTGSAQRSPKSAKEKPGMKEIRSRAPARRTQKGPPRRARPAPKEREAQHEEVLFARPLVSYLGLRGAVLKRFSPHQLIALDRAFGARLAVGRFLFLKLPLGQRSLEQTIKRFVGVLKTRAMDVARMRTAWSSEFQGYAITSKLLESILNHAYVYWVEVSYIRGFRVPIPGQLDWLFGGRSRMLSWQYRLKATLVMQRLEMFDCRASHQARSARHRRACKGKHADEYTGLAVEFARFEADSESLAAPKLNPLKALGTAGRTLGALFLQKLLHLKAFQLHAPIERSTLTRAHLPIGRKEGVRLNQGFEVYLRHVRGHLLYQGYVKVRKVGDNRMQMKGNRRVRLNPSAPLYTEAETITVRHGMRLHRGMLVYEYPLAGISLGLYAGMVPLLNPAFAADAPRLGVPFPLLEGNILLPALQLGTSFDISDAIGTHEVYLNFMAEVGLADTRYRESEGIFPFGFYLGLFKRIHIRRFVWLIGARAGVSFIFADKDFANLTLGGEGVTGFEIFLSPRFSLSLRLGFRGQLAILGKTWILGPWATAGGFVNF